MTVRWAFIGAGWCWVPGPVVVRPVYAPALVAFVGGGGFGVGIGPAVAWFPLAPREVFVPWYRTSRVYVNNVNVTNTRVNVTQVNNVYNTTVINNTNVNHITYANQHVANSVTAVSHDTFVNARPVARSLVQVDPKRIAEAPVVHSVPVQPSSASVMGAERPATARPPASVVNRPVVGTRMPATRPSFAERQPAMNVRPETPGRPEPPVRTENQPSRPAPNTHLEEQGTASRPQPPSMNNRPAPSNMTRPETVPRPPVEAGHPLVRSAPPVVDRPEHNQSEAQKFSTWQQHQSTPAPRPAPRQSPPPAHEGRPKGGR